MLSICKLIVTITICNINDQGNCRFVVLIEEIIAQFTVTNGTYIYINTVGLHTSTVLKDITRFHTNDGHLVCFLFVANLSFHNRILHQE